jgi:hypothetical protein
MQGSTAEWDAYKARAESQNEPAVGENGEHEDTLTPPPKPSESMLYGLVCVFRAKSATDSAGRLPPIPPQTCH